MPSIIPIAYYTGTTVLGTTKQGNLIIGDTAQDYGAFPEGIRFWATTNLDNAWCIAHENPSGNQPNPLGIPCYLGFFSGASDDEVSFLNTADLVTGQNFNDVTEAVIYMTNPNRSYWTNYVPTSSSNLLTELSEFLQDELGNNLGLG